MADIELTQEEIEKLVKESNEDLIEGAFSYPYYGNELVVARKEKLGSYEKYVNSCLQSLKQMVEQVNGDYTNDVITSADVEYMIDDQLDRLQQAVSYTISSMTAIVDNNGRHPPAGPQYPAMMEKKES